MTQPEALRLADALDELDRQFSRNGLCGDAAAELRRLHAERTAADGVINDLVAKVRGLQTQRDALLEALKLIVEFVDAPTEGKRPDVFFMRISKARAAIAKAEQNT